MKQSSKDRLDTWLSRSILVIGLVVSTWAFYVLGTLPKTEDPKPVPVPTEPQKTEIKHLEVIIKPDPQREKDIKCLADNIYYESRAKDKLEAQAITNVVINRVENKYFPNTICGVIYQPHQFSWTSQSEAYKKIKPQEQKYYDLAMQYANEFYEVYRIGGLEDITNNSILYRAGHFFEWGNQMAQYGQHYFGVPVGTHGY